MSTGNTQQKQLTYTEFEEFCGPQLYGCQVPQSLWPCVYSKLKREIFDAGEVFALAAQAEPEEEEEDEEEKEQEGEEGENEKKKKKRSSLPYLLIAAHDLTREDLEDQVWLLDHAWTFRAKEAKPTLEKNDQLRQRVSQMLLGRPDGAVEEIVPELWARAHHYRIASESQLDEESCWYLLDEVGTAIDRIVGVNREGKTRAELKSINNKKEKNSEEEEDEDDDDEADEIPEANVALAPLFYPPANCAFSIVWFPASTTTTTSNQQQNENENDGEGEEKDAEEVLVEEGTLITCDVARGVPSEKINLTWIRYEAVYKKDIQEARNQVEGAYEKWTRALVEHGKANVKERVDAILDRVYQGKFGPVAQQLHLNGGPKIKVCTDQHQILSTLSLPQFEFVQNPALADIIWSAAEPLPCEDAPDCKYVNFFHNEDRYCNKGHMARTMQEALAYRFCDSNNNNNNQNEGQEKQKRQKTLIPWLPLTFDATSDLEPFLDCFFLNKEAKKEEEEEEETNKIDNLWISKPKVMARSMDMSITDDPKFLLRIGETIPKILCQYLSRPATLRGRKYDLRLCVYVRGLSEENLEVYLDDRVWVRTAGEKYSRDNFEQYEKHFTVMNYASEEKLLNLLHDDFVSEFDKQIDEEEEAESTKTNMKKKRKWKETFGEIIKMLQQVFVAIAVTHGKELETPYHSLTNSSSSTSATSSAAASSSSSTSASTSNSSKVAHRRALYGLDIMLDEDHNPYLLEITFSPDINRACKFFPSFVNEMFKTLYQGVPTSCTRIC